jgi:hypothetical protein
MIGPHPGPAPQDVPKPLDGEEVNTDGGVRLDRPPAGAAPLGVPDKTALPAGMVGSRI